jgi:hypothetical protein
MEQIVKDVARVEAGHAARHGADGASDNRTGRSGGASALFHTAGCAADDALGLCG